MLSLFRALDADADVKCHPPSSFQRSSSFRRSGMVINKLLILRLRPDGSCETDSHKKKKNKVKA